MTPGGAEVPWADLDVRDAFAIDPAVTFLNHGSFGACPRAVLEEQHEWRADLEREPVRFLATALEEVADRVREKLAAFVGADADDLAFVTNATTGVNTVLRSLELAPGDELLTTDHEYNASKNALDFAAARGGARVVVAAIPFPLRDEATAVAAILDRVTRRTRLALIDHVTSPTGLVLPIEKIVAALAERGVETLVDGAHAPGMLDLDVERIGAAYYTGNCHKWLCTPKGSAFLHVRRDRQERVRPLVVSHGANAQRRDRSLFRREFDWQGTHDPSPWLCIPRAIEVMGSFLPGGWADLRRRNHALVCHGRRRILEALGVPAPCPESMLGSLASIPLPDSRPGELVPPHFRDPLHETLFVDHGIEVPVMPWPAPPHRLLRISAQIYNRPEQYVMLAEILPRLLAGS